MHPMCGTKCVKQRRCTKATEDDASYGDSRDGEVRLNLPQGQIRKESRELQWIRRERDLLQRELDLVRREVALERRATHGRG